MVERHWPYYLKTGYDILGVGRLDSICNFPAAEGLVAETAIGKDEYVNGDNLPLMHVRALEFAMSMDYMDDDGQAQPYDLFCLTEPDAVFFKPLPLHRGGLMATYCGGNSPGFLGSFFCHGPWYFDRNSAFKAVEFGKRMIARGLIERGFPDRFWGLWCDLYGVRFTPLNPTYSYSVNRIDRPEYVQQAREAVAKGVCYVHGVKTQEELNAITAL